MTAVIIDGKKLSEEIKSNIKDEVELFKKDGIEPCLATILVGEDPASKIYLRIKHKNCEEVGIKSKNYQLSEDIKEDRLIEFIKELNEDESVHGILLQLPLPQRIDEHKVISAISPEKDVDGLHPVNMGKLLRGESCIIPCTPYGIQKLLMKSGYDPEGKHVVICGRSNLVGKPLAALLMQKKEGANATVTICHTGTKNMSSYTKQADILVAAMGSPKVITADMIKKGAIVIDVGINKIIDATTKSGYRLVGDTDFETIKEKAEAITPVPGGVGPMTAAMLLYNTLIATSKQTKHELRYI
ncbi:MAG: bifunctional methylenetetrahydrofolate dehydrogenase/methenyltetrahydrofolate cyclohydrolase FolD [archaeon]|nr:bifunctional methylenetetrahydrofolate dehydrogenase/methenyltetrahydrofolate cyclohydrolase FolD [archaeon]